MKMLLTAALFVNVVLAAGAPVREVQSECPSLANQPVCQFRNGYMFQFDTVVNRVIRVYAPDGRFTVNLPIQLPGASVSWPRDVAVDSDGTFVAGAFGGDGDIRHPTRFGVAMFDANGIQTAVIDTKNFSPNHVTIAADHSIWVLGSQMASQVLGPGEPRQDYMILRKYTRDGTLAGSYLPRSTFPAGLEPGAASVPAKLMAAGNRIAVVAFSGKVGNLLELIELDPDGNVLGRMRSDNQNGMNYALTTDGHFFGSGHRSAESTLLFFDVAAGTLTSMDVPQSVGWLMGADGENLVYRIRGEEGQTKAGWFNQPAVSAVANSASGTVSRLTSQR
jgi:hypothetical protein